MKKRTKKAAEAPTPNVESTWTRVSPSVELQPPLPVQFTPRQLAYLCAALGTQSEVARDATGKAVVEGCFRAASASMRDWWNRYEAATTASMTFTVDFKAEVPAGDKP